MKRPQLMAECAEMPAESNLVARLSALERLQSRFYKHEFLPMASQITEIGHKLEEAARLVREASEVSQKFREDVHGALFDQKTGLVYLRNWLCTLARGAAILFGSAALIAAILANLKDLNLLTLF